MSLCLSAIHLISWCAVNTRECNLPPTSEIGQYSLLCNLNQSYGTSWMWFYQKCPAFFSNGYQSSACENSCFEFSHTHSPQILSAPARNSSSSPEDTATQSAEPQPTREKAAVPQSEDQPSEPVAQEEWVVLWSHDSHMTCSRVTWPVLRVTSLGYRGSNTHLHSVDFKLHLP